MDGKMPFGVAFDCKCLNLPPQVSWEDLVIAGAQPGGWQSRNRRRRIGLGRRCSKRCHSLALDWIPFATYDTSQLKRGRRRKVGGAVFVTWV